MSYTFYAGAPDTPIVRVTTGLGRTFIRLLAGPSIEAGNDPEARLGQVDPFKAYLLGLRLRQWPVGYDSESEAFVVRRPDGERFYVSWNLSDAEQVSRYLGAKGRALQRLAVWARSRNLNVHFA